MLYGNLCIYIYSISVLKTLVFFLMKVFTSCNIYCTFSFDVNKIKCNSKCPAHQDVKLTASNDDYYFVFEDFLYQVGSAVSQFSSPSSENLVSNKSFSLQHQISTNKSATIIGKVLGEKNILSH